MRIIIDKENTQRLIGDTLSIDSPYDKGLVDAIKVIDRHLRHWDGKKWFVLLEDPNQKADEMTNLEWIVASCAECAQRRNFDLIDKTQPNWKKNARLLEQDNNKKLIAVLKSLPTGILKLVEWRKKSLIFQLSYFAGDENFNNLREVAEATKTPVIKPGFKSSPGWEFEIPLGTEVFRTLSNLKVGYLEFHDLEIVKVLESGAIQARDSKGIIYVGFPISLKDPNDDNNRGYNPWELAIVNGVTYQVVDIKKYLEAWNDSNSFSIDKNKQIDNILKNYELDDLDLK